MEIYVADLAAYNAGTLRGEWIELDMNVQHEIQRVLDEWNAGGLGMCTNYRTA